MSSVLTSNLQTGGAQFQNALANSQNAINALLRQAGVTGDTSGYSAAGAVGGGGAPTLGTLSYGPEGAFSEAYQAGGNIAAEQAMQSRSRGLGKGGLASQRQELALMQTQSNAADVTKNLIAGVSGAYGDVNSAYVNEQERIAAEDAKTADLIAAGSVVNPEVAAPVAAPVAIQPGSVGPIVATSNRGNYVKKGTPRGPDVPKNPKPGRSYKGTGGVTFVYRSEGPKGPGWYHK